MRSQGKTAEIELREEEELLLAREKELQARREARRLKETRSRLQGTLGAPALRQRLQEELLKKRHREQQLEEALKDARPDLKEVSKEGQWLVRIGALQEELKQKTEKVKALRQKEQQLEAELRSRFHADAELLPGLRLVVAELAGAAAADEAPRSASCSRSASPAACQAQTAFQAQASPAMNGVQSLPTSYQVSSLTMPAAPVSSLTTPATPVQSLPTSYQAELPACLAGTQPRLSSTAQVSALMPAAPVLSLTTAAPVQSLPTSFQAPELPACLSTPPRLSSAQVPSPIPAAVKSVPAFQAQSDTVIGASAAAKLGPAQAERFIPNQHESSPKARFAEPLAPASGPGSQVGVASSRSSPTAVQRMIQDPPEVYAQPLNFSQVGAESSFPSSRISTGSDKEERWTTPVRRLDASLPLEPEDRCTCGSTFVPDALFCQTCGRSRRQDSGTKEIRFDTRTPPQVSYPVSFPAQASFPAGCQACPARSALHGRAVSPVTLPPRGAASMATSPPWQGAAQARSLTPPPSQRAFASRLSLPARPAMAGARGGARPPSVPPLVLPGGAFAR